jgi:Fic family protein
MNLKLEFEFSKADILKEVDELKKQIDAMRPLPADVEGRVMQKLRLDWNYHSNAIEGNRLNYGETVAFLMEGITAKGKPLKDHLDIRGHNEAINFLLEIVKDTRPISEADIRALHKMILVEPYDSPAQTTDGLPTTKRITLGEYKTSPNHVKTATGEIHYYATPEETPAKMEELMEWYNEVTRYNTIHPVVIAAFFHHKFVEIHPFDDGNGRMSRILMNLILMQYGYPPVIVKLDDRTNYYSLLSRADNNENWPFVEYIAELLKGSLRIYLNAAVGEDIDDDNDIDKEIALFKMQIKENSYVEKKSFKIISDIIVKVLDPLLEEMSKKAESFNDLFVKNDRIIRVAYEDKYQPETFSNFTQSMLNFISSRYSDFGYIEIVFTYISFKSMKKPFTVRVKQKIVFNTYNYEIANNHNKIIISKKYHETLSPAEKKSITKYLIDDIKSQISQNLEQQKSPKP